MIKIMERIKSRFQAFIVAFGTLVMSFYVFGHLNYLDDPRVTPFPPNPQYREALGFTDDWWFATLLVIASLITLFGIFTSIKKATETGLILSSGIYLLLTVEFALRGVFSPHFNITWIACGILEVLILSIIFKGGDKT